MYPTNINYDATIPSPQTFLGRPLGSAPIRHHELVDYLKLVASLSNRLTIETIGFSHERRPILFVVATSESNQDNIDAIKKQHIALTEPKLNQNVKKNMPVVTWLNYGVHGAESSGMDAALPTVYHLAAAKGKEIDATDMFILPGFIDMHGHIGGGPWQSIKNPNNGKSIIINDVIIMVLI